MRVSGRDKHAWAATLRYQWRP